MNTARVFAIGALIVWIAQDWDPALAQTPGPTNSRLREVIVPTNGPPVQDALEWLVGKWRCLSRTYRVRVDQPLGSHGEDALDYLNVYFPYADDQPTVRLTENPDDRQIAAEFLVRQVAPLPQFEERLAPMSPWGPVFISKDRIWIRESPLYLVEFHYKLEKRKSFLWLVLESKSMRLELYKLTELPGDIKKSTVVAPIKSYSSEKVSETARRYKELVSSISGTNGPAKR